MPLNVERIRTLREKKKLTQEQAAELAGMKGRQAWYNVESGREKNLTLERLEKVAAVLGCKAQDLIQ